MPAAAVCAAVRHFSNSGGYAGTLGYYTVYSTVHAGSRSKWCGMGFSRESDGFAISFFQWFFVGRFCGLDILL